MCRNLRVAEATLEVHSHPMGGKLVLVYHGWAVYPESRPVSSPFPVIPAFRA